MVAGGYSPLSLLSAHAVGFSWFQIDLRRDLMRSNEERASDSLRPAVDLEACGDAHLSNKVADRVRSAGRDWLDPNLRFLILTEKSLLSPHRISFVLVLNSAPPTRSSRAE